MTSIAEASTTLFSLLEPFSSEDRARIIRGTLVLLGEEILISGGSQGSMSTDSSAQAKSTDVGDAASYFNAKKPSMKIEEFAIAARFLEITKSMSSPKKEDFKSVITGARRDFDEGNFARDIGNAKAARLFNNGGDASKGYTLSYFGESYVDALPDREAIKKLAKPKKAKKKKAAAKSKAS